MLIMKKETRSYIINILKSEYFLIDLINMIIAIAVLAFAIIAFITGKMSSFGIVFVCGALMSIANLIKTLMRKSLMGSILFSGLTVLMFIMTFVIYGFYL